MLVLNIFFFFFSSRRRHTRSVSAFLLNRSSDLLTHVFFCVSKNVSVSCAYTQGKREQFSGFNRTLDDINNVFRKFSAFHDETGRLNVDGMNTLPPETELSRQMTTSTTSIDIMGLQAAYANLHTDQERDYFMQRYHDVISSFGGKTSYDADNRPLLVM